MYLIHSRRSCVFDWPRAYVHAYIYTTHTQVLYNREGARTPTHRLHVYVIIYKQLLTYVTIYTNMYKHILRARARSYTDQRIRSSVMAAGKCTCSLPLSSTSTRHIVYTVYIYIYTCTYRQPCLEEDPTQRAREIYQYSTIYRMKYNMCVCCVCFNGLFYI